MNLSSSRMPTGAGCQDEVAAAYGRVDSLPEASGAMPLVPSLFAPIPCPRTRWSTARAPTHRLRNRRSGSERRCSGSTAHRWRDVARATALHLRDNHVGDLTHAQRRRMAADFGNLACGAHERTNTLIAVARRKAKALHHGSRERGIRHEMALKVVHDPSPPCFMDVHDARNAHLALIMDAPAFRNVALQRAD